MYYNDKDKWKKIIPLATMISPRNTHLYFNLGKNYCRKVWVANFEIRKNLVLELTETANKSYRLANNTQLQKFLKSPLLLHYLSGKSFCALKKKKKIPENILKLSQLIMQQELAYASNLFKLKSYGRFNCVDHIWSNLKWTLQIWEQMF